MLQIYNKNMKITIKQILSIGKHGASCHLLILDGCIKILLDCGINNTFDFSQYEKHKEQLQGIRLGLISHSSLQYSGAFIFLVQQLGLNPKIFYTTQPIMRYAPLNLHEELLNYRCPNYTKKLFNKIYNVYEEINLVKPYQRKLVEIDMREIPEKHTSHFSTHQTIYFSCSLGGGSLGSVSWRINLGLINLLYLLQYNNFSLHHLNGLDLEHLRKKPIDILLTDTYQQISDTVMNRDHLYESLYGVVMQYNKKWALDANRTGMMGISQKKLLITCYPNQILIEVMHVMKKIVQQVYDNKQKIKVIHLSSKYIQLIKSQIQYFSEDFKNNLEKINESFMNSRKILPRINIATLNSINGMINDAINFNQLIVYHVGNSITQNQLNRVQQGGQFLSKFKLFKHVEPIIQQEFKKKENTEKISFKGNMDEIMIDEIQEKENIQSETEERLQNSPQNLQLRPTPTQSSLHGKYISKIGFPHFVLEKKQSELQFNQYGLKNKINENQYNRPHVIEEQTLELQKQHTFQKKKSTIQVMNIEFKIPQKFIPINIQQIKFYDRSVSRTNFTSSIQVIRLLKPKHVVLLNESQFNNQLQTYKSALSSQTHKINLYDLGIKKNCHIEVENQLIEYKINYIPEYANVQITKVKGTMQKINGSIHIHIEASGEKEILQFRMEQFYKKIKNKVKCGFTGKGIIIEGIMLYKSGHQIILEGQYSEEFFKVREMLYEFLKIRQ